MLFSLTFAYGLHNASFVTIYMMVNLPDDVTIIHPDDKDSALHLHPNILYNWTVPSNQYEDCFAVWRFSYVNFSPYDTHYDQGHSVVYRKAEQDGLYHSWNNMNFVKNISCY